MIHIVSCTFRTSGLVYDHRQMSGGAIRVTATDSGRDLVKCRFFGVGREKGSQPANDVLCCPAFSKPSSRAASGMNGADAVLDRHMAEARRVDELMRMIEGALNGGLPRQDHP
ncbi:hypothetical protein [Thioclava sp. GXIMD2076]|uniref:hypothetical protein n=1 Tax=Thioclava sp. GXIMD2076 TaxID=3131931 RepID=UPI0030CE7CDD